MERRITPTAFWCGAAVALLILLGNAAPMAAQPPPGWPPSEGGPVPDDRLTDPKGNGKLEFSGAHEWIPGMRTGSWYLKQNIY
jgi:hypothetical protein